MEYRNIVCGVTGSAHAQKAALEAAVLAKRHNANLIYVYVVDTTFLKGGTMLPPKDVETSLERIGHHILELAEQIALTQGVTPKKVVKKGTVLDALKEVVTEEKADLLILGHEKRTFFEKAMFKGDVEDHVQELKQQTGVEVNVVS